MAGRILSGPTLSPRLLWDISRYQPCCRGAGHRAWLCSSAAPPPLFTKMWPNLAADTMFGEWRSPGHCWCCASTDQLSHSVTKAAQAMSAPRVSNYIRPGTHVTLPLTAQYKRIVTFSLTVHAMLTWQIYIRVFTRSLGFYLVMNFRCMIMKEVAEWCRVHCTALLPGSTLLCNVPASCVLRKLSIVTTYLPGPPLQHPSPTLYTCSCVRAGSTYCNIHIVHGHTHGG